MIFNPLLIDTSVNNKIDIISLIHAFQLIIFNCMYFFNNNILRREIELFSASITEDINQLILSIAY